ncbi:MAG: hypothetical protein ACXWID_11475 [Pyrinomonadaceae bacterium]
MNEAKRREKTDLLKREAHRFGIPIPREPGWWYIDQDVSQQVDSEMWELIRDAHEYLTDFGIAATQKLIREEEHRLKERFRRDIEWERKNTQWKLTIAGVIIGWVLGVGGIIIAVISLFRN